MQPKPTSNPRVEQDYRIFFIFMTAVMAGMYFWTLYDRPQLRQSWLVIPFSALLIVHIIVHWNVNSFIQSRSHVRGYIFVQSALSFVIVYISGSVGMLFALYMALIGETIGFLGANRWGFLAIIYYLALSLVNFTLFTNFQAAVYWLLTSIPVVIFVGLYVTLYNRQAEARERAQDLAGELESVNQQLREYSARVEDLTITNERQRMARELHDTLSQGLAGLILQLEAADARLEGDQPEKARAIIGDAMQHARATLADARGVIDDLRKNNSGDLGDLLRLEISRFENATGIACSFHLDIPALVPELVKETVIRAAAEALTNIARHARAASAALNVQTSENILMISIKDDGQGFDPGSIPPGHYGLLGLRERVRLCGGSVEVESALGKGTVISIVLPLEGPFISPVLQANKDEHD